MNSGKSVSLAVTGSGHLPGRRVCKDRGASDPRDGPARLKPVRRSVSRGLRLRSQRSRRGGHGRRQDPLRARRGQASNSPYRVTKPRNPRNANRAAVTLPGTRHQRLTVRLGAAAVVPDRDGPVLPQHNNHNEHKNPINYLFTGRRYSGMIRLYPLSWTREGSRSCRPPPFSAEMPSPQQGSLLRRQRRWSTSERQNPVARICAWRNCSAPGSATT